MAKQEGWTPHPGRRLLAVPGWLLAILYVAIVALPLVLAAINDSAVDFWTEAAIATGIVGGAMMLLQIVSSGRFRTLSGRVGIDITMGFHRWAAPVALVLVLLHPALLALPIDWDNPGAFWERLWNYYSSSRLRDGVIAVVLLVVMVAVSLLRERLRIPYEFWRATHAGLALALVWFTIVHILDVGYNAADGLSRIYWPVLGALVVLPMLSVYLRKWIGLRRHGWQISAVRPRGARLWEVTLTSGTGRALPFRAGQFGWLAAMESRLRIWFDHPFSISSSPRNGRELRFIIQEAGDFTETVGQLQIGRTVGLDAPHGCFTTDSAEHSDAVLLIAGGVGIAPIVGILEDLAERQDPRPVRLIYAARDGAAFLDRELLEAPLKELDAKALYLADDPGESAALEPGPIGEEHLRRMLDGLDPERSAALICGPGGMTSAVTDTLYRLGMPVENIHYERFDYSENAGSVKDRMILNRFRLIGAVIVLAAFAFALR